MTASRARCRRLCLAYQMRGTGAGEVVAEVLEILRVGDVVEIHAVRPARRDGALVLPEQGTAVLAPDVVVRQVAAAQLARHAAGQVAQRALGHGAAVLQPQRGHGGVVVGCQVEVIGHPHLAAGVVGMAQRREQEPRLARAVE